MGGDGRDGTLLNEYNVIKKIEAKNKLKKEQLMLLVLFLFNSKVALRPMAQYKLKKVYLSVLNGEP